jgi:hypothetical protein
MKWRVFKKDGQIIPELTCSDSKGQSLILTRCSKCSTLTVSSFFCTAWGANPGYFDYYCMKNLFQGIYFPSDISQVSYNI